MNILEPPIAFRLAILAVVVAITTISCAGPGSGSKPALRLATTTSTEDSGLLAAILPDFEEQYDAEVDVIAVGTGQALTLGEHGDVDVVLVHARAREDAFVSKGFGINRRDVMYNDFVIVGPDSDVARVRDAAAAPDAFTRIAETRAPFVSRGDQSGTHDKELAIWDQAGTAPAALTGWYQSLGQGMGETLIVANELRAYTLTDRATFMSMRAELPSLVILFGGDSIEENPDLQLHNPYGVILVNPALHPDVNEELAATFIQWLTAPDVQAMIGEFGREHFGQPIFLPAAEQ